MAIIRESEYGRITAIYERQAASCVNAVTQYSEEIAYLARKTRYEPLVNFANRICALFKGELRDHLLWEFRKWYDGEYSLHALARSIKAGYAAESRAREYMDEMEVYLRSLFAHGPEPVSADTSEPQIEENDFALFEEALNDCVGKFQRALDDAQREIRGMAAENDAVNCITGIVGTTGYSLIDSFIAMMGEVESGLGAFKSGVQKTLDSVKPAAAGTAPSVHWSDEIPFI